MAHVTAFAQHILTLEPDKDPSRLCLYHFLKNLCEPMEPINSELLNRFFCRALAFTHWQQNKATLFQEVNAVLAHYQETHQKPLSLNSMFTPEQIQVVPVETIRSLELVISRYLEKTGSPFDQYRVIPEGDDRLVAITLQGDRSLRVTVYPKVLAIREGELVPLTQELSLLYTPDLQLHPMMIHQLDVGPHTTARFRIAADGIRGTIIRGYTFQKYSAMDGGSLHRYPVLFYPLKRLEQFFVNRKSDPMYIELTGLLEKALELISNDHPEALKFAAAALERGRLALEHIFPDDKLVRLLINNLEKTIALESARHAQGPLGSSSLSMHAGATALADHAMGHEDDGFGIDLLESAGENTRNCIRSSAPSSGISSDFPTDPTDDLKEEKWQKIRKLPL